MKIGYARVSTEDQKLDLQRDALRSAGCERIYTEKLSGVIDRRPALDRALKALRSGDVLVVWKLDRLGRSLQDLLNILNLLNAREVGFCTLSGGIDTTTAGGKLLYRVSGAFAEFEHELISERTKAGMAAARRKGSRPGRPRRLDDMQTHQACLMAVCDDIPLRVIAERMAVSKTTVWRAVQPFRAACAASTAAARVAIASRNKGQRPAPGPTRGV